MELKSFDSKGWRRWFAGRNEVLMFSLALIYLICVAILVVIWVDMPSLKKRAVEVLGESNLDEPSLFRYAITLEVFVLWTMGIVWCVVIAESIVHWMTRPWNNEMRKQHLQGLLFCICPALRMGARSPEMHGRIWLPGLGWRQGGRRLQRQLERQFSVPMMIVALLIMPILVIEFFLKDQVAAYGWLRLVLHFGTGVIWFAFAAEFILMVSIAEKKIQYCKDHWIDLAIILIPLISFLRSLSLARTIRLTEVVRFQQLSNALRAYRLRGTAIKAFRVLVLFDIFDRILRPSCERRIEKMELELQELEKQSRLLRQRIAKLKIEAAEDQPDAESAVETSAQ
ncbi:prefoldin domain-containing protein [Roseiconus lacunae]|uniref:Potassium channel protein n=2 Tax=Roseiconus lacunae TaxID=2605694 RepID=A0ABT7PD70_9BACT|nr:potassium channel protein [Roseiconus lacunae]MDM4014437.1 potassium channel protein [Roseiconus lacunae]